MVGIFFIIIFFLDLKADLPFEFFFQEKKETCV